MNRSDAAPRCEPTMSKDPLSPPEPSRRDLLKAASVMGMAALLDGCDAEAREQFFAKHFKELDAEEKKEMLASLEAGYKKRFKENIKVSADPPMEGVLFGYALDLSRCIGCRRCVYACVAENNQSRDPQIQYIRVLQMHNEGGVDLVEADPYYDPPTVPTPGDFFMPVACQQCENPPCVKVCPVGATWAEPDGIVVVDYDWCIGCRYCMAACPYEARAFNWGKPKIQTGGKLAVNVLEVTAKGDDRFMVTVVQAMDAPPDLRAPQVMPTVLKRPFIDPKGTRFFTDTVPVSRPNPAVPSAPTYTFEVVAKEPPAVTEEDGEYGFFLDTINTDTAYLGNRPRPKGVVEKCTFCIQRVRQGRYPACVEICPVGARKFGNLLDAKSDVRYIIENKRVFILKEELNTKPKFFYFYGV